MPTISPSPITVEELKSNLPILIDDFELSIGRFVLVNCEKSNATLAEIIRGNRCSFDQFFELKGINTIDSQPISLESIIEAIRSEANVVTINRLDEIEGNLELSLLHLFNSSKKINLEEVNVLIEKFDLAAVLLASKKIKNLDDSASKGDTILNQFALTCTKQLLNSNRRQAEIETQKAPTDAVESIVLGQLEAQWIPDIADDNILYMVDGLPPCRLPLAITHNFFALADRFNWPEPIHSAHLSRQGSYVVAFQPCLNSSPPCRKLIAASLIQDISPEEKNNQDILSSDDFFSLNWPALVGRDELEEDIHLHNKGFPDFKISNDFSNMPPYPNLQELEAMMPKVVGYDTFKEEIRLIVAGKNSNEIVNNLFQAALYSRQALIEKGIYITCGIGYETPLIKMLIALEDKTKIKCFRITSQKEVGANAPIIYKFFLYNVSIFNAMLKVNQEELIRQAFSDV